LQLENVSIGFSKHDPYITNKFESILSYFPEIRSKTALGTLPSLRSGEMNLFSNWPNSSSLLNYKNNQDPFSIYLKNSRILKRIAIKIHPKFQDLQDSLLLCAIEIENRMPEVTQNDAKSGSGMEFLYELEQNIH